MSLKAKVPKQILTHEDQIMWK